MIMRTANREETAAEFPLFSVINFRVEQAGSAGTARTALVELYLFQGGFLAVFMKCIMIQQ
jgi:hypothetical protein